MSVHNTLKVLIVGFGFMGENHFNNLKEIEKDGIVSIAGVIDNDSSRLSNKKLESIADRCFENIERAYASNNSYDIVVVVTNTTTHHAIIGELFKCCLKENKPFPALFVEKPLVETTQQAETIIQSLQSKGFGKTVPFTCGYLFRESPALDEAIKYFKDKSLNILKVRTIWQKLRDTKRPSAGVHIDEATHPIDVLVNYLFPVLGLPNQKVSLKVLKREYSKTIVNEALQAKFYGPEHIPLATVDYTLTVGDISIEGHSSFKEAPQRREIWLECDKNTLIKIAFDDNKADSFTAYISGKEADSRLFKEPNKLLLEWQTFLNSQKSSAVNSPKIPSLHDTFVDIKITEALGKAEIDKECTFQF